MGIVGATSAATGCEIVINLREHVVVDDLDGTGAASGSGGAAGQGGTGAGGSGGSGASGGTGGAQACSPGETEPCYSGADGTEGVGVCLGGSRTCEENGSGFGVCEGEVVPGEEDCATLGNEACTGAFGCSDPVFFRQYGDSDIQWGTAVAFESETGTSYVAGALEGAMKIGDEAFINNGGEDVFLARLDPTGEPLWARSFGSDQIHSAWAVAASPDGGVVALVNPGKGIDFGDGQTALNSALVKLDASGNVVWTTGCTQETNPGSSPIQDMAVDGAGNVIVIGHVSGSIDCGTGSFPPAPALGERIFIAKFSAAGVTQWMKLFAGIELSGSSVAVDPVGNIVVGGSFSGKINFGAVNDGIDAGGDIDAFVVKLDSAGGHEWSWRIGDLGAEPQRTKTVATDSLGAVVAALTFAGEITLKGESFIAAGSNDLLITKIGAGGSHEWAKHVGSLELPEVTNIDLGDVNLAIDGQDNVVLAGLFQGTMNFGGEDLYDAALDDTALYLAKLDSTGAHRWSKQYSASKGLVPGDLTTGVGDGVLVVGGFEGMMDVGVGPYSAKGVDVFVAYFAP